MGFLETLGLGTVTSLFQGINNSLTAKSNYKYASKLQQEQFNNQVKLIDAQNAYNSPANQMQLAKDAGLNPYTAITNNLHSQQPSSGSTSIGPFKGLENVSIAQNIAMASQINNQNAQTENIKANTEHTKLENEFLERSMENRLDLEGLKITLAGKDLQIGSQTVTLQSLDIEGRRIHNRLIDELYDNQVQLSSLEVDLKRLEVDFQRNTQSDRELSIYQNLLNLKQENKNLYYAGLLTCANINSTNLDNKLKSATMFASIHIMEEALSQANQATRKAMAQADLLENEVTKSNLEMGVIKNWTDLYIKSIQSAWITDRQRALQMIYGTSAAEFKDMMKETDWVIQNLRSFIPFTSGNSTTEYIGADGAFRGAKVSY